jgi:integrase
MSMKASHQFSYRRSNKKRRDQDHDMIQRNGVYSYKRRVPKEVLQAIPDAPKQIQISLGTRSVYEARELRDKWSHEHDSKFLAIMKDVEAGKTPRFLTWQEFEHGVQIQTLTDAELDEVIIPEGVSHGTFEFDRKKRRTPAVTVRELMIGEALDKLQDTLPRLWTEYDRMLEEGEIFEDTSFDEFLKSSEGRAILTSKPESLRIVAELDQLTGAVSWESAADAYAEHKLNVRDARKKDIKATAMKLSKMDASPPASITEGEVSDLIADMAEAGLKNSTIETHLKRVRAIVKVLYRKDSKLRSERVAVWQDHDLNGVTSKSPAKIRPEQVELLMATEPPTERIKAYCRCMLYLGTRPGELLTGHYNERLQLFEIAIQEDEDGKTESSERAVPVHPEIAADLKFLNGLELSYGKVSGDFRKWRSDAGLSSSFTLHSFRHGFATRFEAVGVAPYYGAILAGHTLDGMWAHYREIRAQDLREHVLKLDWHTVVPNWS